MIEVFPTQAALADAAANAVVEALRQGLRTRGRAGLVGTGGRSPGPVYDRLQPVMIDWERVVVTLSDERCVSPDDPDSNLGLLRERLLVGEPARAHILPLWPAPDPRALAALLPFDAVLLGMGEDGHVASLIPGSPTLAEGLDPAGDALTVMTPAGLGSPPVERISLTIPALLQSRLILVLIAGDAKRAVVESALAGADVPVRSILAARGRDGRLDGQGPKVRILWTAAS